MKRISDTFRRSLIWNFMIGMASVFCPSVIHADRLASGSASSDFDNISNDWKAVGGYISNAYETISKHERR